MTKSKQYSKMRYHYLVLEYYMDYIQKYQLPTIEDLYNAYFEEVHKRIYFLLSSHRNSVIDTDDLSQEVWVKVSKNYHKVPDDWNVRSWVLRVAVNVVIDYIRKKKRTCEEVVIDTEFEYTNEIIEGPEKSFIYRESITNTLSQLRETDRTIVCLYGHGFSYDEIRSATRAEEITSSGIKMSVSRSRKRFQEAYKRVITSS